jgi:hypothetical protein
MKLLMVPAILACSGNVFEDVSTENQGHDLKLPAKVARAKPGRVSRYLDAAITLGICPHLAYAI